MSTAMNFGSKSFRPRAPDKGAFPLDHFGELIRVYGVGCCKSDHSLSLLKSNVTQGMRVLPDNIRLAAHWWPTGGRVGGPTVVPTGGPLEFCSSVLWRSAGGSEAVSDKGPPFCRLLPTSFLLALFMAIIMKIMHYILTKDIN